MDKTVKYYMAPLESVTTWIYRQAHAKIYGRLDKYFIPFLEPHEKRDFKTRELQEILPEHNENISAVPQILTNRSEGFIKLAKALKDWGYEEINLNLGCPSKTVVTKGKGSGFLAKPEELERFLTEIFDALSGEVKISVKTRIGKEDPEEFPALLELFNKYPMEELIIHPRVQKDGYGNVPRLELYELAEKQSVNPLCYNGDLYTREQIRNFAERCGIKEARKFATLIIQNLTKGNEELAMFLGDLSDEMWEIKKNEVKQKGEKANSKLLLPVFIIFIGILILVLVPAMSSMG